MQRHRQSQKLGIVTDLPAAAGPATAQRPLSTTLGRTVSTTRSCPSLPSIQVPTSTTAASECLKELGDLKDLGLPKEGSRRRSTEQHKFLHEQRQREWLRSKAKDGYIDFSDEERAELRRYFDALATSEERIGMDRLETMLISLGLASTRKEVKEIVDKIDDNGNGELDFDEYLELFRHQNDSQIFKVFKAMMEGKLGDRNLNFQTVISTYRRQLFLDATGARTNRQVRIPSDYVTEDVPLEHSVQVLQNFARMQNLRYNEAAASAAESGRTLEPSVMTWEQTGGVPPGGLGMLWRGVANENKLFPRPTTAERKRRSLGKPKSPRTVIHEVISQSRARRQRSSYRGSTVVVGSPGLDAEATQEIRRSSSSKSIDIEVRLH
mmetsp:Transcript_58277/g.148060  ORF Transcript_58277/g.148060 Transcript_58277/m.148060 type:complete len:380 (+) Transcript_58277:73-1212(+)